MELGMIGLGRMGGNMARRLISGGHRIAAYNRTPDPVMSLSKKAASRPIRRWILSASSLSRGRSGS